jgi:hypothetical protein
VEFSPDLLKCYGHDLVYRCMNVGFVAFPHFSMSTLELLGVLCNMFAIFLFTAVCLRDSLPL